MKGALISGNYDRMVKVIKILEKPSDKRKDKELINYLVPILAARNFFKS